MKTKVKFTTNKINHEVDPSDSYTLQIMDRPVYDESRIFGEVVKDKTLPFDEDMLQFAFLSVLKGVSQKVAHDCNPRRIGNYLKFLPTIRGKVKGPYSAYDPETCSTAIVIQSLSGLEKSIDMKYIQFVNVREGVKGVVRKLAWLGSSVDGEIKPGEKLLGTGDNLAWLDGDRIEFSWKAADGTQATGTVTSVDEDSDVNHIVFDWPAALDGVAEGTEVEFTFYLRGGLEEADANVSRRKVIVLAGEEPPEPPAPTGEPKVLAINGGTFLEGGGTVVHGENMKFVDSFPGNHVIVMDSEGTDMGAMISTDESIPITEESFGLTIDAGTPFTEGETYRFVFSMVDADGEPVTVTQTARYVSE